MKTLKLITVITVFLAVFLAATFWINGELFFVLSDDSMISMWYAKQFFHRIIPNAEGFSNPLWTFLMVPLQILPENISSIAIALINLGFILLIMKYSENPLLIGLTFPLLFWAVRGTEFIPMAFFLFYGLKTGKVLIPALILTLLRADGFIFALILFAYHYKQFKIDDFAKFYGLVLVMFITRYLIFGQLMPNTYYLKMDYSITERITRALDWYYLIFLLAPKKYIFPVLSILAYNTFIGGDAWEQYPFLNRFLTLTVPLMYEYTGIKDNFIIQKIRV